MERDENGRALAKYGRCGICGKRVSALADEDFECCEEDYNCQEEEEEGGHEPASKLITVDNHMKMTFSAKDIILAMIGIGWKDFKALRYELRSVGFDTVMVIDEEVLVHLIEELEEDEFVEVYWDTERVRRIEQE